MITLLNPKIWIAIALAAALAFSHFFVYRAGKAQVRTAWDEQKLVDLAAARAKEQEWQAAADAQQKAKDEQISKINRRLVAALGELRNRPERPAVVPENSGTCRSGTGAGLYRPDGEFLARLAARADAIAAERDACYTTVDKLRAAAGR